MLALLLGNLLLSIHIALALRTRPALDYLLAFQDSSYLQSPIFLDVSEVL
mgnify:CR=1 FL=1